MEVNIRQENCITCKIIFWVTASHQERLKNSHEYFYCPNGHSQYYRGETEEQKISRIIREKNAIIEERENRIQELCQPKPKRKKKAKKISKKK